MFRVDVSFLNGLLATALLTGCGNQPSAQVNVDSSPHVIVATPTPSDQSLVPLITPTGESVMSTSDDAIESNDDGANTSSQNDSGIIPGSLPSAPPPETAQDETEDAVLRQPTEWITYADPSFGFSIEYPDTYVIIETADISSQTTTATHSVHFQDAMLAQSETANLQPPQFTIDVFEIPSDMSFEQWIDNDVTFSDSTRESVDIGGRQGYMVTLSIQLAPNQFYYVADDDYYYKLIPLGLYGERMLQSFTIDT